MSVTQALDPMPWEVPLYHFTDKSNVESILKHGLLSTLDLADRGMTPKHRGGNDFSRYLDREKGIEGYVHLSLTKFHRLSFVAEREGRIASLVNLRIAPEVVSWRGVLGCRGVSNSRDTGIRAIGEILTGVDLGVLHSEHDRMSRSEYEVYDQVRRVEVLVPRPIPPHLIEVVT